MEIFKLIIRNCFYYYIKGAENPPPIIASLFIV